MEKAPTMIKVFHFDSPREQYQCDAAVVWCFDLRFDLVFRKFLTKRGITRIDAIKVAGGAKCLASPDHATDDAFVLDQIRKSIRLHQTKRVILMVHSDCGAYGGLGKFGGDTAQEAAHHVQELHKASEALHRAIPNLEVEAYFVDFEGVWAEELK